MQDINSNKINILVLTSSKFNERDYYRFGLKYFKSFGFNIIIFDLSYYLKNNDYLKNYFPKDSYKGKNLHKINSISELNNQLSLLNEKSYALLYVNLFNTQSSVINSLTNYKIKYCQFVNNISVDIRSFLIRKASFLNYIYRQNIVNYHLNPPDILFYSGKKALNELGYKRGFSTKKIEIPSDDYSASILKKNSNNKSKDIVFIDQFWPFHPDLKYDYKEEFINAKKYHQLMNMFFDKISKKFNMSVGIVPHPRANYEINPYDYPILKEETIECLRNAKLVLAHHSTAISFALSLKIPILFLSFKEIRNHFSGKLSLKLSKILGSNIIFLDEDYLIKDSFPKCNTILYEKYIKNYMYSQNINDYVDWKFYLKNHVKSIFEYE